MENTQTNSGAGVPPRQYPVLDSICMELKKALRAMEPSPEVREHLRNARIEALKGLRQVIDNRIERLTRNSQPGQKINVE